MISKIIADLYKTKHSYREAVQRGVQKYLEIILLCSDLCPQPVRRTNRAVTLRCLTPDSFVFILQSGGSHRCESHSRLATRRIKLSLATPKCLLDAMDHCSLSRTVCPEIRSVLSQLKLLALTYPFFG